MKPEALEELADSLRRGETPRDVATLKVNPVRQVVRADDVVLKLFLNPQRRAARESRALEKAASRGVPVPELLASGPDWVATRWFGGRAATRADLSRILPAVEHMHEAGMLHGDLHLGNCLVDGEKLMLLDLQRSRFWPALPRVLRHWELGQLAYSLGEPLPESLQHLRFWQTYRAHRHWRSRTRRSLKESSRFTRFSALGLEGYRLREADTNALVRALETLDEAEPIWTRPGGQLYRSGPWVVKQHGDERSARAAWVAGHGLEARGIRTALPVACLGPWLVMEDAGPTVVEWAEASFAGANDSERSEMMQALSALLSDLHRRGIYHADMKACNITWRPGDPPRLLDYEKVRFGRRVPFRRRMKNLAQLNSALPDVIPNPLREQGLQRYLECSAFRGDVARLRREVIELSLSRQHRWRGCSASGSDSSQATPTSPR